MFPAFAALAGLSLVIWMVFLTIYITYITVKNDALMVEEGSQPFVGEFERSSLALAASGSAQSSSSSSTASNSGQMPPAAPPVLPMPPPTVPTTVPGAPAPPVIPTATPAPKSGASSGQSSSGGSSSGGSSSKNLPIPIATKIPRPTPTPIYPRLKFKLRFPDISRTTTNVIGQAVFFRQNNLGRLIRLSETKTSIVLRRVENTDYFASDELIVKIAAPLLSLKKKLIKEEEKKYAVFVKTNFTVGRLFSGIVIKTGKTAKLLDCAASTIMIKKDCAELATMIDQKPFWAGDSDGFLDGSPSYNLVDVRDLEIWATGAQEADFNLDDWVDEFDLGVLIKNYGQMGDTID